MTQKQVKPVRIQRKRTKGWKMPDNTVCITRPGRWSNPFQLRDFAAEAAKDLIKMRSEGGLSVDESNEAWIPYATALCVQKFKSCFESLNNCPPEHYNHFRRMRDTVKTLQGKNLACFCKEGESCHGDILLQYANL